jgi:hypothetical protein
MAEIVEFRREPVTQNRRRCYSADSDGLSGRYVRESDYAALLERHGKAIKVLRNINERCRVLPYRLAITPCLHDAMDAALTEEVYDVQRS